jgi:tetratricopeptide (TPR) repeat protein
MLPYYKEEKEASLHRQLSQRAVELAIEGRWEEAGIVNRDIIERFPTDVEAYNRLGRTLAELGDFAGAREAYVKALEFAPANIIAKKNLDRLTSLPRSPIRTDKQLTKTHGITPELFAAEMGKAGVVKLYNIASSDVLAKLVTGDEVQLKIEGQRLLAESEQGEYLGEMEPKHAVRLIKLINGGNRYNAAVLNVEPHRVQLIIKETYQHPSQVGYLSFLVKDVTGLRRYAKEGIIKGSIEAIESEAEEFESSKEVEYAKDEEEFELEGFTMLDESAETDNERKI